MLTPEVYARAEEHLRAIPLAPCWVCGNPEWQTQTIIWPTATANGSQPTSFMAHNTVTAPMLLVACTNCFNTVQFLWVPIRDKVKTPQPQPRPEGT